MVIFWCKVKLYAFIYYDERDTLDLFTDNTRAITDCDEYTLYHLLGFYRTLNIYIDLNLKLYSNMASYIQTAKNEEKTVLAACRI